MDKLVLIDGNSLFNRAFFATPVFTTSNGTPTNAVFGFVKLLFKIMADVKPRYLVVAFDMKAPTFRHNLYEKYKATRKPMPDDLAVQVEPLKNLLKAMKIATCQKEGIEADDILGTLSARFDVHSYIYTGDRDSYQLVDDKTDVYYTKKGVSDILRLNAQNFKDEIGIEPAQVVDLKALMGDKSDNIPGIQGIGEKTARDLIARFQTLDGIYENIDELKGATRDKFLKNRESAYLSYKLAKIDRNCDLDIDLADCLAPERYSGEVKKIFSEFEFRSLLNLDIFETDGQSVRTDIVYPDDLEVKSYNDLADILRNNERFSVVLEEKSLKIYTDNRQFTVKLSDSGTLIPEDGVSDHQFGDILCDLFSETKNKIVTYDFKRAMHMLSERGIEVSCDFDDVSLIKYLCDYNSADTDLKGLCSDHMYDFAFSAFAVNELYSLFHKKLTEEKLVSLYEDVEKPLLKILWQMEDDGVKVSGEVLDELSVHYGELVEEYRRKVYEGCGCEFNINSPSKLGEVLYEKLGLTEVRKKNTGKYTTSAEVLEKLVDKSPVVGYVLKYRQYQKLFSTYIEGFKPLIGKGSGIVHTTYHQTATATGRLSSSNPNLQNIPIREDEGRELRKIFIPRDGCVFIDADYSQIELRLLAHFSGCKELIEAYNSGIDVHTTTASQVFGVPMDEVTQKMRREAKAVNFGIIYGISEFGLSRNLNIPIGIAKDYIAKYFERYSAVKEYMNANVAFARENGFVVTLTGRKRVIPEINSSNYNLRQFGERAAMNMPLQGSSADIIKIAMINVCRALREENMKTKLIMQVHDELVLEAPEEEKERAAEILKQEMENAVKLKTPLTVEVHCGKNWFDAK